MKVKKKDLQQKFDLIRDKLKKEFKSVFIEDIKVLNSENILNVLLSKFQSTKDKETGSAVTEELVDGSIKKIEAQIKKLQGGNRLSFKKLF